MVQNFGKIRYLVFIQDKGREGSGGAFGKIRIQIRTRSEEGGGGSIYLVWIQEFSLNFGPHPLAV